MRQMLGGRKPLLVKGSPSKLLVAGHIGLVIVKCSCRMKSMLLGLLKSFFSVCFTFLADPVIILHAPNARSAQENAGHK
jgi:hypothetical protein